MKPPDSQQPSNNVQTPVKRRITFLAGVEMTAGTSGDNEKYMPRWDRDGRKARTPAELKLELTFALHSFLLPIQHHHSPRQLLALLPL